MARSLAALAARSDDQLAEIEGWYRAELARPVVPGRFRWEPVRIGPTWQTDGDHWLLPEKTLGWGVLAWCGRWLQHSQGLPWQFTPEQARFVLWWYSVDDQGLFVYRDAVLQRLKGWGKDPVGACLCLAELLGPCRFDRWVDGRPVGMDVPDAWVQTAAVSIEQTKNTMRLLPGLISDEATVRYNLQVGKEQVYALGSTRLFQAVTSSPTTLEGARATFVLPNETQHWNSSNSGHDMADVIERNATKSPDGSARTLRITNAPEPGQDSVAERDRDAYQDVLTGRAIDTGLLYDSLEAAPEAPLDAKALRMALRKADDEPLTSDDIASVVGPIIESVRGDSTWLSVTRIVKSIMDPRNSVSRSARFWYNQIVAAEDAWADPNKVKQLSVDDRLVDGDEIVIFGDGSKSDDATGLVGVRISDGLAQALHVQQPLKGKIVDRAAVDHAVIDAFATYKVIGFWFDPSHTKDDNAEEDSRFWWPMCDEWMARYGQRLTYWATQTGTTRHAVVWDMSKPTNQAQFVPAVEQLESDIDVGLFQFHRSSWLQEHLINARRAPGKFGVSMRKDHRESRHKIDLAVCAAGARMMWRHVTLSRISKGMGTPGRGRVIAL